MLKLTETRKIFPRLALLAGQKVSRKYRQACIRRYAYRKLKAIVPSIASREKVSKIKVIEEAIKYIDELHYALIKKAPQLFGERSKILQSDAQTPEQFVFRLLSMSQPPKVATSASATSIAFSPAAMPTSSCTCTAYSRSSSCTLHGQIARTKL